MSAYNYIDIRNLKKSKKKILGCPIDGCNISLVKVTTKSGTIPYCPLHKIKIHESSSTFVYYNGTDVQSKKDAALRNVLFERHYFKKNIIGHKYKAESHRFCNEMSEDALTWNVFSSLARNNCLSKLLTKITNLEIAREPELYLWGLKINLDDESTSPSIFPPLLEARNKFEKNIVKFKTEPDIMLYIPGQVLVLIEAKFTSGNTLATSSIMEDLNNEKPKSREGILKRYSSTEISFDTLSKSPTEPFFSQLYRNLVFAIQMANKKNGQQWFFVNLVSKGQQDLHRKSTISYQDPTQFIHSVLPERLHNQFRFYSWEQLYYDLISNTTGLEDLANYLINKSAKYRKALDI